MTESREDALLQFPRIVVARLEHVAAVIRLHDDCRAAAQTFSDEGRDMTEVHHRGNLHALVSCSEAEVVDGIVRNRERMKIYFADAKIFARFNFFYSIAERFGAASGFVVADVLFFTNVSIERLPGDVNRTIDRIE